LCLNSAVSLGKALKSAIEFLSSRRTPSPRMNAELLLMFTLGCDRAYLYGHPERELTEEENSRYQDALTQRAAGIPAQYITGHQEFWGMDFIVSPSVLIPRPETEHVIETVLQIAKASASELLRIIDVGTGSGCIALALARELPRAQIDAVDISPAALAIATANAARLALAERISFRQVDLLEGTEPASLDFVVSNPPYVGLSEEDAVQLEVRKFEPRTAVFAGAIGMEIIDRLIPMSLNALKPGGWLVMEISGTIAARVRSLLTGWKNVQLIKDLQGIERVVAAQKPDSPED
jgi:release factor glutamine methyltransferase